MARIHLFADNSWAAVVLDRLAGQCGIPAREVASLIQEDRDAPGGTGGPLAEVPRLGIGELGGKVAAHDVIIVAGDDLERRLALLFGMGFHNAYNGNELVRRAAPAERFLGMASGLFLGPIPPVERDPGASTALQFTRDAIRAGQVPGHKLFVVNSMPKSGTLWMVGMLAKILGVEPRRQIIVSHVADLEVDWPKPNNHGAVVMVRDLRDVVVSWFHDAARTDLRLGFREPRYPTVREFYWEFFVGTMAASDRYYRGDLCHWINKACAHYVPLVRYEDMRVNALAALRKVLNAWRVEYDAAEAARVCEDFAFDRQAAASHAGTDYVSEMFRGGHVRRGAVGGWKAELPGEISADIERRFAAYQERLGYAPGDGSTAFA